MTRLLKLILITVGMLLVAAAGLLIWSIYMNSDVRYRAVAHAAMDTLKQQQIGEYGSERIVSARFCGHDGELQAEVIRTNDSVRRIKYLYDIKNCQ